MTKRKLAKNYTGDVTVNFTLKFNVNHVRDESIGISRLAFKMFDVQDTIQKHVKDKFTGFNWTILNSQLVDETDE
jgi:hypothetical protein